MQCRGQTIDCRYKHLDLRPWSERDVYIVERDGKIFTMSDRDCEEYYEAVRDAVPEAGQSGVFTAGSRRHSTGASSVVSANRLSIGPSTATMASMSPTPNRGGGGGNARVEQNADVDTCVATLYARVVALEAHIDRVQRTHVPLIGLLFAVIQILLPIFIGLITKAFN